MKREKFENLDHTEAQDYDGMEDEDEQDIQLAPNNDLINLKRAGTHMPNTHKEKQLRACVGCRLVMSDQQWKDKVCPNCGDQELGITANFTGLVSIFMPSSSWVAKWNNKDNLLPGIYAINIDDSPMDMEPDHTQQQRNKRKQRQQDEVWSDPDDFE